MKFQKSFFKRNIYIPLVLIFFSLVGLTSITKYEAFKEKENILEELALVPDLKNIEVHWQSEPVPVPVSKSVKIPIFIYHSVRPHYENESALQDFYDTDPILLEKQLVYLKENGYTTINLDTFVDYVKNGIPQGIKPVVLSFDDGWENQYKYAFPLLKKYNEIGVFYVYTNPINNKRKHFLTWDEVKEMDKAGMMIASHTIYHSFLPKMNINVLRKELVDSKKILEDQLGKPVNHFASPFGSTNADIQKAIKDAGYITGRTTYRGAYHTKDDLLKLRGILSSDDLNEFIKGLNL